MNWRDKAACLDADPELFAPVTLHTDTEWQAIEAAAHRWCGTCPVMDECRRFADDSRHTGLYGGVYRRVQQSRYVWRLLAEGATEPQLTDRRAGVRVGWDVA